jgi:small subunit ribosomal protein S16
MPTKIRLQRRGMKGQPFFHIVIADGRAPRDGRFIEKIGTYNPLTRPADIQLDFDRALYWVKCGAQPTETVEAILKYTGVAYMHHLLKGVTKGAMTEEQAQAKFEAWKQEKDTKIASHSNRVKQESKAEEKKRLEAEAKVNEAIAKTVAKKRAAEVAAEAKAEDAAEVVTEVATETAAEVVAESVPETVVETATEAIAEVAPEPAAETVAETVTETVAEVAPATEEAPADEATKTPEAEA